MSPLAHSLIDPVIGTLLALAIIAVLCAAIHFFLTKTRMGARIMDKTPWAGWTEEEIEDQYTNFRIHPSNYIKVPSNH